MISRCEKIVTSESISEGHPDKVCDRISDAVLDLYLEKDHKSRLACEAVATKSFVLLAGEARSRASFSKTQIESAVRAVIREIGYEQPGFHWKQLEIENRLHEQSADIAMGVDRDGAGDQGIMFGYACDDTPCFMPAPHFYATAIIGLLEQMRKSGQCRRLGPDAKSQVSLVYADDRPVRAHSLIVSTQHSAEMSQAEIKELAISIAAKVLPEGWLPERERIHVNPTGQFIIGGPEADTGLTGRKIITDTYGGAAPHGGGAFSGKDPSKVDRSAAYICRYMAKNIVAAGLARRCTIQISYAIGLLEPQSLWVDLHHSGNVSEARLEAVLRELVDLTPRGIINRLELERPIYARTASGGHFGREPDAKGGFSWEKLDLVEALKSLF